MVIAELMKLLKNHPGHELTFCWDEDEDSLKVMGEAELGRSSTIVAKISLNETVINSLLDTSYADMALVEILRTLDKARTERV